MDAATMNNSGYTTPLFDFEKNFDHDSFIDWMQTNWTASVWYAAIYVITIMGGKRYMDKRQRFELRWPLAMWSGVLAIFSIFGAIRTFPELVYVLRHYGFGYSVCSASYVSRPTAFWTFLFAISKVYELGDTIFIVLRKQPLIFLHWYHHVTVMIYVWYSCVERTAPGRWFMVMNYVVHSFMYTYYTLKAFRFRIPKFVSVFITTIQISQMVMGLVVNITSYYTKSQGLYCQQSWENLYFSFLMYCSYFVLFAYFFYKAYIRPRAIQLKQRDEANNNGSVTSSEKKLQ